MAKLNLRKTAVTIATVGGLVLLGWICSTWIDHAPDPSFVRPAVGESELLIPSEQWHRMDTPDGTSIVICDGEFRNYGTVHSWRCRKHRPPLARLLFLESYEDSRFFQLRDWIARQAPSHLETRSPVPGPHQELVVYLGPAEGAKGQDPRYTGHLPEYAFSGVGSLSDGRVVSLEELDAWQAGKQAKEESWLYRVFGVESAAEALIFGVALLISQWWWLWPLIFEGRVTRWREHKRES